MAADPELTGAGELEWRDSQGRLHRDDGPARIFPSGREEWYRHGRLHREDGLVRCGAPGGRRRP